MITTVDTFYSTMGNDLKLVSEAAKNSLISIKKPMKNIKIYGIITALNEQAQSPSGSLISFNQNVNALIQEYKKQLEILILLLLMKLNPKLMS